MPKRRRNGLDTLDDFVEIGVEALFDKGAEMIARMREQQSMQIPAGERAAQAYTCMFCKRKPFSFDQMEVVSGPVPNFGMCKGCFAFVWKAGEDKVKFLAKKAQERGFHQGAAPAPAPQPQARPPWEILGISENATIEDAKKAWKSLAAKYHPDMVPPGPNATEEREAARLKFEEVTRARDVFVKIRTPPVV